MNLFDGFGYINKSVLIETFAFIFDGLFFHGMSLPEKNEQLYKLFGGDSGKDGSQTKQVEKGGIQARGYLIRGVSFSLSYTRIKSLLLKYQ